MRCSRLLVLLLGVSVLALACAPTVRVDPSPSPAASPHPTAIGTASTPAGLASPPRGVISQTARWYLVPDGLSRDEPRVSVDFGATDVTAGRPRARLVSTGRTVDLVRDVPPSPPPGYAPAWSATVPVDGAAPGRHTIEIVVRTDGGADAVIGSTTFMLSQPEYVAWTLDFEGDAASNETLDNTWDIARTLGVPMTIMWNPRVWTTDQVSPARADVMAQWMKNIASVGMAEIALHLHAWTDFVRAAGVTPRTAPSWSGRSDGYDVPLTAFDENETRKLIDHALQLMSDHGLPKPTTFRAGGLFANAGNLRAVAAAGFSVDTSATPAGVFGLLPLPWTLPKDAQPYRPSRDDANRPGDLPLLEVPNIAGNTYALDARTIGPVIQADLAMLAPVGQAATTRRALTLVSHPGTVNATERAAIESLFRAFEPYRYDKGNGPLRFVTLAQLAKAYGP